MIISVVIDNFQSHKHTEVDLIGGVNVIIGPSDAGKSSIFRAINWVISNRPLGDAYRSEWGGDTRVILKTDDGQVVERIRTDKDNMYIVNGMELKAFGTEPPEAVHEALRIDSYSIQTQDDPPFLLSMSPGEAAQVLNKAASIDVIDRVIGGLNKEYRRIGQRMAMRDEQLKKQEAELDRFLGLPEALAQMDSLEEAGEELEALVDRNEALKKLYNRYRELRKKLKPYAGIDKAGEELEECLETFTGLEKANKALAHTTQTVERYMELFQSLGALRLLEKAEGLLSEAQDSFGFLKTLSTSVDEMKKAQGNRECLEESLLSLDEDVVELVLEYKEMSPDNCPLCGGVMPVGGLA